MKSTSFFLEAASENFFVISVRPTLRQLDNLHLEHPFMGTRMLYDQLNLASKDIGRKGAGTL